MEQKKSQTSKPYHRRVTALVNKLDTLRKVIAAAADPSLGIGNPVALEIAQEAQTEDVDVIDVLIQWCLSHGGMKITDADGVITYQLRKQQRLPNGLTMKRIKSHPKS